MENSCDTRRFAMIASRGFGRASGPSSTAKSARDCRAIRTKRVHAARVLGRTLVPW